MTQARLESTDESLARRQAVSQLLHEVGGGDRDALAALVPLVYDERDDSLNARIVECRFYAGLTIEDTAEALAISPATVKRRWSIAQAWLYRDLRRPRASTV